MIDEKKRTLALKALQDLLINGKKLSFEKLSHEEMFEYFDSLEYLPYLMYDNQDYTDDFESYFKGICEKFNCMEVWNRYVRNTMK